PPASHPLALHDALPISPVPAGAAALPPQIVIGRVAAHIHHTVDRAGAAKHLAARLVHAAALELWLGLALEHPVDARIGEQPAAADRKSTRLNSSHQIIS